MREAVRLVVVRNHALTVVLLALVTALVTTIVVLVLRRSVGAVLVERVAAHGDVVRFQVVLAGGLHEQQDVEQELQVLGGVLAILVEDPVDVVSGGYDCGLQTDDHLRDLLSGLLGGAQIAVCRVLDVFDELELVVQHELVGVRVLGELDGDLGHSEYSSRVVCFV